MENKYTYDKTSKGSIIFIFRRDLRINDNVGLQYAISKAKKESLQLLPLFIFNSEQINSVYSSKHALSFMYKALKNLEKLIKINYLICSNYEKYVKIIIKLTKLYNCKMVIFNKDYTSYAIKRDTLLIESLKNINSEILIFDDALLFKPELLFKSDGKAYKKFTPFHINAMKFKVNKPIRNSNMDEIKILSIESSQSNINKYKTKLQYLKKYINNIEYESGENMLKKFVFSNIGKKYNSNRNFVNVENTTSLLSAHLRFGTISVRYVYWVIRNNFGKSHKLLEQLYWRDFYYGVCYYYYDNIKTKYNENKTWIYSTSSIAKHGKIKWCKYNFDDTHFNNIKNMNKTDKQNYINWCDGNTGIKIVDDAMIQLNKTGYIHNRQRMIVASYLIFYLNIHWKFGEVYFSQQLIDHDYVINLGNWKWVAAIEPYSNNPNHIFSMESQEKRFYNK